MGKEEVAGWWNEVVGDELLSPDCAVQGGVVVLDVWECLLRLVLCLPLLLLLPLRLLCPLGLLRFGKDMGLVEVYLIVSGVATVKMKF